MTAVFKHDILVFWPWNNVYAHQQIHDIIRRAQQVTRFMVPLCLESLVHYRENYNDRLDTKRPNGWRWRCKVTPLVTDVLLPVLEAIFLCWRRSHLLPHQASQASRYHIADCLMAWRSATVQGSHTVGSSGFREKRASSCPWLVGPIMIHLPFSITLLHIIHCCYGPQ